MSRKLTTSEFKNRLYEIYGNQILDNELYANTEVTN